MFYLEYEGFDDVYGHSVEDDHCISPSEARFLYDRTRHPQMSAFINEENYIAEEDEHSTITEQQSKELNKSQTRIIDEDKLRLCMDDIQNVVGDMFPTSAVEEIVLKYNYDVQKSLDHILNDTSGSVLHGLYLTLWFISMKCFFNLLGFFLLCRISILNLMKNTLILT